MPKSQLNFEVGINLNYFSYEKNYLLHLRMPIKEFLKYLDNNRLERLRIRLKLEKGEIIELVYQYESFINDKWNAIVRYDTAHGFFHRDVIYPNGDQEKYSIEMDSLKVAASFAEQDIKDRWEFYKNRYIKKLKK